MIDDILKDAKTRMGKSVDSLENDLGRVRTGRAHPSLLESVRVDYYGAESPLSAVANVNTEDARTLTVTPWEQSMVKAVEKAIIDSGLGLNPNTAGTVIRVPVPPMTEERRRDMVKLVRCRGRERTRGGQEHPPRREQRPEGAREGEGNLQGRAQARRGARAEADRRGRRPASTTVLARKETDLMEV